MYPARATPTPCGHCSPARVLLVLLACLLPWATALGEAQIKVSRDKDRYKVAITTEVPASVERVRAVLTDYAHLDRLHKSIRQSTVIATDDGHPRVRG